MEKYTSYDLSCWGERELINHILELQNKIKDEEAEQESHNKSMYMLLGSYDNSERPNIEIIYSDADLNKVKEVYFKIETLLNKYNNTNNKEDLKPLIAEIEAEGVDLDISEYDDELNIYLSLAHNPIIKTENIGVEE